MMMTYGTFVFSLSTAAYEQLQRQMTWRHASSERLGARPARQYVGPGDDSISLQGTISAELVDNLQVLDELRELADQGKPQALVEGSGRVYGAYLLVSLSETRKEFFPDGTPRLIEFQLQLERDDDGAAEAVA
ncbi:phage tail protein [Stenotrophomonas maltophilia]|uniref:Phage tail protein n=1 Tax=Stenotrophomonas maltophilia (strain K279a) TaxID=522373 RepID=B2FIX4_STRMK|nr:phage tail protein [Stenotrophomonas maltophilia]EKT4078579.1 phage tail protein [Stenotrophomonas maltophilia]CAQ43903.1 putative phage tail protein [Stenotrophomonas maltophilia K279a]